MAKYCKQCGKKIGFFENGYFLNNKDMLCDCCAKEIRCNVNELYETSNEEEFLIKAKELVGRAEENFNDDVVSEIIAKIERIGKSKGFGDVKIEVKRKEESSGSNIHITESSEDEFEEYHSKMFSNIGSKIKVLAVVITCIGIVASIIIGIVLMTIDEELIVPGILVMIVGSLLSWLSSFFMYGFGQLVENSDKTVALLKEQNKNKK